MRDIIANIQNTSRNVLVNNNILGSVGENLQGNLIVDFAEDFIDGHCSLECQLPDGKSGSIEMTQNTEDKIYSVPIKSALLQTAGTILLQIRITEVGKEETPIFKSEIFSLSVLESIVATEELPDEYEDWITFANKKLAEVEEAIARLNQTTEDLGVNFNKKVDKRLSTYTEFTDITRLNGNLFIDDDGTPKRISLKTIKSINTKILAVSDQDEINTTSLAKDDYIFIKG